MPTAVCGAGGAAPEAAEACLHKTPSAMMVFALVLFSYFLVMGGIIYDVIVEPPSISSTTDEHGHLRPVAFMQYHVNGQYIMGVLASSFLFTMGGLGFIVLECSNAVGFNKLNRALLFTLGFLLCASCICCLQSVHDYEATVSYTH